jgi:hypothetical protein
MVVGLALLGLPPLARAQDCPPGQPPAGAVQVILEPADGHAGPLTGPIVLPGPEVPGVLTGSLEVIIGFSYLRPHWDDETVRLVVPPGVGGVPGGSDGGDLSHEFAFVPRLGATYTFTDLGFGVGATVDLMNLHGELRRTLETTAGVAVVTAESDVDLAVANLLEVSRPFLLVDHLCVEETCWEDVLVVATIGGRYAYLHQNSAASLLAGGNLSTLSATQNFTGFGLTGSVSTLDRVGESNFFLYSVTRGSLLVGSNDRTSFSSVEGPLGVTVVAATESKTDLIPVGELEAGIAWSTPVGRVQDAATGRSPLLWIKVGAVGQLWGDLGLLAASSPADPFAESHLYLYGVTVLVGVEF